MEKKKYKRVTVGSIVKARPDKNGNPRPDYLQLRGNTKAELLAALSNMDSDKGLILNLESKQHQLNGVNAAEESGKLSADMATKIRTRIEKIPDFVRFEVVLVQS